MSSKRYETSLLHSCQDPQSNAQRLLALARKRTVVQGWLSTKRPEGHDEDELTGHH